MASDAQEYLLILDFAVDGSCFVRSLALGIIEIELVAGFWGCVSNRFLFFELVSSFNPFSATRSFHVYIREMLGNLN